MQEELSQPRDTPGWSEKDRASLRVRIGLDVKDEKGVSVGKCGSDVLRSGAEREQVQAWSETTEKAQCAGRQSGDSDGDPVAGGLPFSSLKGSPSTGHSIKGAVYVGAVQTEERQSVWSLEQWGESNWSLWNKSTCKPKRCWGSELVSWGQPLRL